jgi:hypothetical protein
MDPQELERILERLRQGFTLTADELDKLTAAEKSATKTVTDFGMALGKTATDLAKGLGKTAMEARKSPGSIKALGGIVDAIGDVGGAFSKTIGSLAKGVGNFALNELDDLIHNFNTLANVGVTTGAGLTGMKDSAHLARMNLAQFSKAVAENSESLAFIGGTSLDGAQKLAGVAAAAEPFQDQLMNLGINLEDQANFIAYSLRTNRLLSRSTEQSDRAAAQAAMDLAEELDFVTRLTGTQRSQVQAALEQQLADARFRERIRNLEMQGQGKLAEQQVLIGQYLAAKGGPELQANFQDALTNIGTAGGQEFVKVLGNITPILNDPAVDVATKINLIRDRFDEFRKNVPIEQLAKMGIFSDALINALQNLTASERLTTEQIEETVKKQKEAINTQDKTTEKLRETQKAVRDFGIEIDNFVLSEVVPRAATAINYLANNVGDAADTIKDAIDKLSAFFGPNVNTGPPRNTDGGEIQIRPDGTVTPNVLGTSTYDPNLPGTLPDLPDFNTRASGGPVTGGKPYMVGEVGPELIVPGASGTVISNKDIQDRLKIINDNLGGTMVEGVETAFLPGIGEALSYTMGGITKTMLKTLDGQVEEYLKYHMNVYGLTMEAYKAGGQTFARGSATNFVDFRADTGFRPTGGPSNLYQQALASVPEVASVNGMGGTGQGASITGANEQGQKFMEQMLASLKQIAETSAASQNTQQQMLRAYSS